MARPFYLKDPQRVTLILEREIRASLVGHIKKYRLGSMSEFVARAAVKDMSRPKGSALVSQSRHLPNKGK